MSNLTEKVHCGGSGRGTGLGLENHRKSHITFFSMHPPPLECVCNPATYFEQKSLEFYKKNYPRALTNRVSTSNLNFHIQKNNWGETTVWAIIPSHLALYCFLGESSQVNYYNLSSWLQTSSLLAWERNETETFVPRVPPLKPALRHQKYRSLKSQNLHPYLKSSHTQMWLCGTILNVFS